MNACTGIHVPLGVACYYTCMAQFAHIHIPCFSPTNANLWPPHRCEVSKRPTCSLRSCQSFSLPLLLSNLHIILIFERKELPLDKCQCFDQIHRVSIFPDPSAPHLHPLSLSLHSCSSFVATEFLQHSSSSTWPCLLAINHFGGYLVDYSGGWRRGAHFGEEVDSVVVIVFRQPGYNWVGEGMKNSWAGTTPTLARAVRVWKPWWVVFGVFLREKPISQGRIIYLLLGLYLLLRRRNFVQRGKPLGSFNWKAGFSPQILPPTNIKSLQQSDTRFCSLSLSRSLFLLLSSSSFLPGCLLPPRRILLATLPRISFLSPNLLFYLLQKHSTK